MSLKADRYQRYHRHRADVREHAAKRKAKVGPRPRRAAARDPLVAHPNRTHIR